MTVWERAVSPPVTLGDESTAELFPTRIGINRTHFYVDVQSRGVSGSEFVGKSEQPRIQLLVDDCPVPDPPVLPVFLPYDGKEVRVLLSRSSLPFGDLDMGITAFGNTHTMLLANDEHGLRVIELTEKKSVVVRPGDPSRGISDTVISTHRECPPEQRK